MKKFDTEQAKIVGPRTWEEMGPGWQKFYEVCLEVPFGEFQNCLIRNGCIEEIEHITHTHAPCAKVNTRFVSSTNDEVPQAFRYLYNWCQGRDGEIIPFIQLNATLPILMEN